MTEAVVPVLVVAGPTASGKSALALDIAEAFDGVVVNADSMQVYEDLRTLSARPDAATEARVPHRLFGILSATEVCSAARWRALALAEIERAAQAGRVPVVTGGSGLYLNALLDGLSAMPEIPEAVRRSARSLHRRLGNDAFHAALAERDPATAARLAVGDSQRLLRAWEVLEATGRSLTEWQQEPVEPPPPHLAFLCLVLLPPREAVYAAIDRRFDAMMANGALDEVRSLLDLGLGPDQPAARALGVPELAAYLDGRVSREDAVAAAKQATRRYAKRQYTWFRHRLTARRSPRVTVRSFRAQYSESLRDQSFIFIRRFLLTEARRPSTYAPSRPRTKR